MLLESTVHTDLSEMTMSMMREKQYEACERRLFAHPSAALFSAEATELDAQSLYEHSFDFRPGQQRLCSLDELRGMVLARLPLEARFVGAGYAGGIVSAAVDGLCAGMTCDAQE